VIISKLFGKDIRSVGSGNIGTTNAMRTFGAKGGALVFILDFGKGLLSGLIALWIANAAAGGAEPFAGRQLSGGALLACAFFFCVAGHVFSPWLHFKGGKGIAVAVGCLFVTYAIWGAVIELAIFGIIVALTRYVSAGSLAACLLCYILAPMYFPGDIIAILFCYLTPTLIIWAHRENIARLRAGEESRIGSHD